MYVYIQVYVFFFMLCSVLFCVGPGIIKSPSKESCQWLTRFIDSHVNSELPKGRRTKMQMPDARAMQFYDI